MSRYHGTTRSTELRAPPALQAPQRKRFVLVACAIAPLWSAYMLAVPGVRHGLFHRPIIDDSWLRAGVAAAAAGVLFVVMASVLARWCVARDPLASVLSGIFGLMLGYCLYCGSLFFLGHAAREGPGVFLSLGHWYGWFLAMPLLGAFVLGPLAWALAIPLAACSALVLRESHSRR